jgi:hypothetical protein
VKRLRGSWLPIACLLVLARSTTVLADGSRPFVLGVDTATGTEFSIMVDDVRGDPCEGLGPGFMCPACPYVSGSVPANINLNDDDLARRLAVEGVRRLFDRCSGSVHKQLPAIVGGILVWPPYDEILKRTRTAPRHWQHAVEAAVQRQGDGSLTLLNYINFYKEAMKAVEEERREELRQQKERRTIDQQRAEAAKTREQQRQARVQRLRAFESSHGDVARTTVPNLFANPYAFRGRVVTLKGTFRKMLSEDAALIECTEDTIATVVVSQIPADIVQQLTHPGIDAVLAVRVLGVTSLRLGSVDFECPNTKFLGMVTDDSIEEWRP